SKQKSTSPKTEQKATTPAPKEQPVQATTSAGSTTTPEGRVKASPLAKKLAKEKGIDIRMVSGTGEAGRIVKKDIETFTPAAQPTTPAAKGEAKPAVVLPAVVGQESFEDVPLSQMRKAIARRVSESKYRAPHFYVTMEI